MHGDMLSKTATGRAGRARQAAGVRRRAQHLLASPMRYTLGKLTRGSQRAMSQLRPLESRGLGSGRIHAGRFGWSETRRITMSP